jgi:transcriptional regulator with XRE-family HTH domain
MPKQKPPPSAREVFARNLRRVRRLKDMTQEQLALEAEVPRAYVSRVERGTINISIDSADKLARAIGTPLRDLVDSAKFAKFAGSDDAEDGS